jgi:hypothetical protein
MAVNYGFYNSLNKDRRYNAEQMSSIFNGIITDGVFSTIGDALMTVAGTGMQVIVKPGRAWFNNTWTLNDAQLPLDVPAADVSLTRIDAVILEVNSAISARANSIKVLKGTPSANPAKPALSATETLHQYALAYITVGAGVTSITAANIEINVGKTSCPFITSVLQQTDITDLFNQWNAEFTTWFENVQAQLSGNVAANLQRQIDERVKIADKATDSDVLLGTNDNKWITPAKLKKVRDDIESIGNIKFTIKNSLGDSWLKCDGSSIDLEAYPEYGNAIEETASPDSGWAKTTKLETETSADQTCAHGPYVVRYTMETSDEDANYSVLKLNIFNINSNTMITKTLSYRFSKRTRDVGLTYQNGFWVFVAIDIQAIYTITSKDDLNTFSMQKFNFENYYSEDIHTWDANESYFVFGGYWRDSRDHYHSWYIYGDIKNPESITWHDKYTDHSSKYTYPFEKVTLYNGNLMFVECRYTGSSNYEDYEKMTVGAQFNHTSDTRYDREVTINRIYGTKNGLYEYLSNGLFKNGKAIALPSNFTFSKKINRDRSSKAYAYIIGTINTDTVLIKLEGANANVYARVATSLVPVDDFNETINDKWFLIGNKTNYGAYLPNIKLDGCNAFIKVK